MIRIVVANQKGGVSKTVTATTLAREFAEHGKKVLIIDTDAQGNVSDILGLQPRLSLYNFVYQKLLFKDCIVPAGDPKGLIDVMCSNRETQKLEIQLLASIAREYVFKQVFSEVDAPYDIVLIDVSPSINLLQTCAMVYAERILIPVAMDTLSFQGATAAIETAKSLNSLLKTNIKTLAVLPVMVDRRLGMTTAVLDGLGDLSQGTGIPLLSPIRTDQSVTKAARAGQFLADYDPKCKAIEDYRRVAEEILALLKE